VKNIIVVSEPRRDSNISSMEFIILKKLEDMEAKLRQLKEERRDLKNPLRTYERRRKWEAKLIEFPKE